jgi:hypothetical protein
MYLKIAMGLKPIAIMRRVAHLVYASLDHLFAFGGKKVLWADGNNLSQQPLSFPLAEERVDERSNVGVSLRPA